MLELPNGGNLEGLSSARGTTPVQPGNTSLE